MILDDGDDSDGDIDDDPTITLLTATLNFC